LRGPRHWVALCQPSFTPDCTFLTQLTSHAKQGTESAEAIVAWHRASKGAGERLSGLSMGRKHTYATKTQLDTLVRLMQRAGILYYEALEEFKKQFILVVLRDADWNKSKAARVLEMHRSTLVRILRELNIDGGTLRNAERRLPYGTGMPRKKTIAG
jgi:Fis family transcriptional regulator, factor for inversion stimulation protein